MALTDDETPRDWLRHHAWRRIDAATAPFASSRAVLVILGLLALWAGHTTRITYTTAELRTRDVCVICLWGAAMIGLAHIVIRPNRASMAVFGMLIMVNAAVRMIGFGLRTWDHQDHSGNWAQDGWHFIEGSNALPLWGAIGYFGFLIWRRRNHVTSTHDVVGGRGG